MARVYDHTKIEPKWVEGWYKDNIFRAVDFSEKPKKYILAEFPYPSGKSLHAGHMMRYTVPDVYSRYLRMNGYNVLFPMGFDAFGLPAENFAVKTGINPKITTAEAIKDYRESFKRMGYSFDFEREFSTTDPKYYKWTQWLFLKFFEAGLAEYKESPVWWCEELRTVLAEEEVLTDKDGNKISERGGYRVVRKQVKQWTLKITKYADKLIEGLKHVDFPESIKAAQTNWIGRSEGAQVSFEVVSSGKTIDKLEVFTTRPDTIFGVTFVTLSPENQKVSELLKYVENKDEVLKYVETSKNKSDLERRTNKIKSGVPLKGISVKHPLSEVNTEIPVFIADYVLNDYGTGVVMGVPAHDDRDKDFAKFLNLPIIKVIGIHNEMMNSFEYNDLNCDAFKNTIVERLTKEGKGFAKITYKIHDWLFSRQRYWGEPIPVIHKENGEIEAVVSTNDADAVAKKLPLVLPDVADFSPTADGESPLSKNVEWVNTSSLDGTAAKRETNTMPNWAGSSWYYLRFIDPKNDNEFASFDKLKYWLPVDRYFGGSEHITLHLLYSRFWHQFFYDQGLVPTPEPYAWRMTGGLLLGPDGRKMSKSIGNIVDPMEMADAYGVDALRMYICFIGPYEDTYPWNPSGIKATYKLVSGVHQLLDKVSDSKEDIEVTKAINSLIESVTYMCENLKMNTAVSEFMKFINVTKEYSSISRTTYEKLLVLLAPFAPYVSEELWSEVHGNSNWDAKNSVHVQTWPKIDSTVTNERTIQLPVQIDGKIRGKVLNDSNSTEDSTMKLVYSDPSISKFLTDKKITKTVYVKGKILSLVTE